MKKSGLQSVKNAEGEKTRKRRSSRSRPPKIDLAKDLWISPHMNLRGRHGDRAWDMSGSFPPGAGMRLLELADIALGNKKPPGRKKNASEATTHVTRKKEPYSL